MEPIKPIVGFVKNGYKMDLTNDGATLINYDGEIIPPELKIINLQDMSYQVYKDYHFSITDQLHGNSSFYIISDKEYIRLYNSKNPMYQSKFLKKKYKQTALTEKYLFGIEEESSTIHIHSLPELTEVDTITLPKETQIRDVIASDTKIYINSFDKSQWLDYIIDIQNKTTTDIPGIFLNYYMKWILEDGTYIIGSAKDFTNGKAVWGVFNTVTLERNSVLEQYLNGYQIIKHISKYSDDQLLIVNDTTIDFWDIKKESVVRSIPLTIKGSFSVLRQNDLIVISQVFSPFRVINLATGNETVEPYARNKPYGIFIEKNMPKAILRYSDTQAGIWNLFEHKWEYLFPEKINPNKIQRVIKEDNCLLFVFSPGMDINYQPIVQWSLSEKKEQFEYPTDKFNNVPDMISIDKKTSKLLIHIKEDKFYIFDMKNGKKLHELKSPDRNPNVYDMEITEDGTKFNVYTKNVSGFVKVEMGTSYKYAHQASIYMWSLLDENISVINNEKGLSVPKNRTIYERNDKKHLVATNSANELFWDDNKNTITFKKLNNPYRFIYLYTPNASSWFDIDNQGYFDSSIEGLKYLYQCQEKSCNKLDDKTIKYFKRKNMLKAFLKEE